MHCHQSIYYIWSYWGQYKTFWQNKTTIVNRLYPQITSTTRQYTQKRLIPASHWHGDLCGFLFSLVHEIKNIKFVPRHRLRESNLMESVMTSTLWEITGRRNRRNFSLLAGRSAVDLTNRTSNRYIIVLRQESWLAQDGTRPIQWNIKGTFGRRGNYFFVRFVQ